MFLHCLSPPGNGQPVREPGARTGTAAVVRRRDRMIATDPTDHRRINGEGSPCHPHGHRPTSRDGMPGWTPRKGPPRGPATGRRRLNGTIPATRPTRITAELRDLAADAERHPPAEPLTPGPFRHRRRSVSLGDGQCGIHRIGSRVCPRVFPSRSDPLAERQPSAARGSDSTSTLSQSMTSALALNNLFAVECADSGLRPDRAVAEM